MRVLITADTVGGVWDYTCTLARGVHDAGHDVLLAVIGEKPDRRLAALPEGVEIVARPYRLEWQPDSTADVAAATEWLTTLAGVWKAEVVHLNQHAYAAAAFPAPTLLVSHSDVRSWFSETRGEEAGEDWAEYTAVVRAGLAGADRIAAPTVYQSELLARHYGRGADRVIHNGVAPPPAAEAEEEPEPLLVCAGRAWDPAKGVSVLDEALGLLGDRAPGAHLLGSTTGPHGESFVPRHLRAHGRVERAEVNEWLRRSGIYAGPSLYEPFGLAPLEAALHGCALVLSDIGSFRELWDGCAEFFPVGDAAALAGAIGRVASDPRRRADLATRARRRAERRFAADRMVGEYLALYAELKAAPRPTPTPAISRPA